MSEDTIRIVRAVGEMRLRRIQRLRWWVIALAVALAGSLVNGFVAGYRHGVEMRACVERP